MPEIFRIFGLRFYFFSNDHEPIHIHVRNADGKARFTVNPIELLSNQGMKDKDLRLAESLILENQDLILEHWNGFFKKS